MSSTAATGGGLLALLLRRGLDVRAAELPALLAAFGCALCMFASYAVLRPVRETFGITSGLATLPALFWGTFVVMLLIQPLYGWMVSRLDRTVALPRIYALFAAMIMGFWLWFQLQADHTWIARAYFIWVSVFNLFVVAVFWSLMADVFDRGQAARLFGSITAGISCGGLLGPLLAGLLARPLGTVNLLPVSAVLLLVAAALLRRVMRWHRAQVATGAAVPVAATRAAAGSDVDAALHGSAWAAFGQVARSPFLLGIAVFVLLLTAVNTVLYFEQQRLVAVTYSEPDARTAFFAGLDFWVQVASLLAQLLLFSRLQRWFGFGITLALVPALMIAAFAVFAAQPGFGMIVAAMFLRRVGEYGLVRPGRDMLYTAVSRAEKYKAKNLIDTFVYRGGDALSASGFAWLMAASAGWPAAAGLAGLGLSILWLAVAAWLARRFALLRRA